MTSLARPSLDLYESWAACVRDFGDPLAMHGSGSWWIDDFSDDVVTCRRLIEVAEQLRTDPPEGLVVSDCYWILGPPGQPEVIGFIMLRHALGTEFLRTLGGHIGYSIRPSWRRRGHASRALGLTVAKARELGIDRVLVTCDEDNLASARTIESQRGVYENSLEGKRRYWIDT